MGRVDLELLYSEMKTQLDTYSFNVIPEDILRYFKPDNNESLNLENRDYKFNNITLAKNEWESCVDSLENNAIIILDNELRVIRANRTIEMWGWGSVNSISGIHLLKLIEPLIINDVNNDLVNELFLLNVQEDKQWQFYDVKSNVNLVFSYHPVRDLDSLYHTDKCYAVLHITKVKNDSSLLINKKTVDNLKYNNKLYSHDKIIKHQKKLESRYHKLAEQLINAQEYERERVSSELHDGIGQVISALKYKVESMVNDSKTSPLQRKDDEGIVGVLDTIKVAMSDLKRISVNLRSSAIDDFGLLITLRRFVNEYSSIYNNITTELQITSYESDIPDELKNVIYRIVQESMNNIAKHSEANNILILLSKSDRGILLRITDDGCGFDIKEIGKNKNTGIGLKSMEDRAVKSNAKFSISSSLSAGTVVQVSW